MRQNKQTVLFFGLRRWLLLAFALVGLCLAAAPPEHTSAQQQPANATQKPRTKRITPLRTSDTADGSRVTITSDGELNDYSAYRSGDRFIVVVPQAEGGGGGARGRGFEGAQVEKRGKDLVYTFKLQPGATARVNQRFNRLDVQFSAPRTSGQTNANTRPTPSPAPTPKRTLPEEAGITKPQTNANNAQPTPDARRSPDANANTNLAATGATPFVIPTPGVTTTPTGVPTPTLAPTAATATPGADTIAQTQPTAAAPISITTGTQPATSPTSVGAVVTRNWPWLLAALLAVALGLFVVTRFRGDRRDQSKPLPPAVPSGTKPVTTTVKETKTAELKPSTASTTATTTGATTAKTTGTTAGATTGATAAASSAATAASLLSSGKQSKKKKKKAEKSKRLAEEKELKTGGTSAAAGTSASSAGATAQDAGAATTDSGAGGALAAGALIAGAGAAIIGGASKAEESKSVETKAIEAKAVEAKVAETKAVEPSVAFEPERIEAEIKKLLTGESYDESVINAADAGTRQLVSAELMSAIAGRNAARREQARTAFLKHGYFDEAARALQSAEAPGERAAAAHTLGLYGERSVTPHLTAALEDPAPDVRRTAVEALAELRDPSAIGALEALRWREVSRQVPRTLIQRAIEATKLAEAEEAEAAATATTAVTPDVIDDDTPTLATPSDAAAVVPAATEALTVETKEGESKEIEARKVESKEIEVAVATVTVAEPATVGAVESDTATEESPVLAATVVEATPYEAPVALDESPTVETKDAVDQAEVAAVETKALEVAAPLAESTREVEAEVETPPAPVEIDLASSLAAKEASLIKAREREDLTTESNEATPPVVATDMLAATPELTNATHSPESQTPTHASSVDAAREETTADAGSSPVYRSDFAVGSGKQAGAGDDVWVDLDADEHEVTIQSVDTAPPAEPLGTFYAAGATEWALETDTKETPAPHTPEASRQDQSASLFDTLEVEAFETNAADAAPVVAAAHLPTPAEPARAEDLPTQPLDFKHDSPAASEVIRGTEVVKADKGLSLVDGSDEEDFSIIPKGIQLRLTSDDASERAASVLALSRLNTDEAFNEICTAFDDPAEEVRNAAARALYDIHEDRADSFTRALRESPVERRRQIGAALAGSGLADEAVGNLTGESRDKTYDAFSLLFLMAKAGEVAPLIRAIESHPDNEVRLAVVKLLALSGQQEILPAFRRLAVRGSLPTEVRSAVMEAIYQISSQPQNATPAT
ncbi:MAG TPA: HEAT repeat domain-containing protein [Pyrinomonadaceae bacterium]|nr:HEAT repeat domain-containing protein [Pyrinomonadaceae bacterium]